jgi:hypothetical protein
MCLAMVAVAAMLLVRVGECNSNGRGGGNHIATASEFFEGHTHPQHPNKLYPLARGVVPHPFDALARGARPHVG